MAKSTANAGVHDRILGCMLAAACGDALGAPVETMTPGEILEATDGEGITGYRTSLQRKIPDTMHLPKGSTTDDTQLTLAVADSLLRLGRFDLESQARTLVEARFGTTVPPTLRRLLAVYGTPQQRSFIAHDCSWRGTTGRWGTSTENAVVELARHFAYRGERRDIDKGRSPDRPVTYVKGKGDGNGPAMKIAPLAIAYPCVARTRDGTTCALHPDPFMTYAFDLARQTHGDIVPAHGSVAVGAAIATMLAMASETDTAIVRATLRHFTIAITKTRESYDQLILHYSPLYRAGLTLSNGIGYAVDMAEFSVHAIRGEVGNGFRTIESVPFAIAIAWRNVDDVEKALLEAVNAGGDADTNASIVGAIVGARIGASRIPKWLVNGLPKGVRLDIENAAKGLAVLHERHLRNH